eukprot:m.285556 g.285556  ORF g.285556 m.285556 type:complete len:173 (-) comp19915_c0_seq1:356-874(-)
MRAVVQRVLRSSVTVDGKVISAIDQGMCVLLGITHEDTDEDVDWICRKMLNTRLWPNEAGKEWGANVTSINGGILVVSQFTLYAKVSKGSKPDFHLAMPGDRSRILYSDVLARLEKAYKSDLVKGGQFGAMMEVSIVNDGPVTIILDSNNKDPVVKSRSTDADTESVDVKAS